MEHVSFWQQAMSWVAGHLGQTAIGVLGIGGALVMAKKYLPGLLAKYLLLEIEAFLGLMKTPTQKAWGRSTIAVIEEAWPDAGDARYGHAADWTVRLFPVLGPFRPQLFDFLTALGKAVDDDLKKESKAPDAPPVQQ